MKVVDMQCRILFWECMQKKAEGEAVLPPKTICTFQFLLKRAKKGDYLVQNFAIFTPLEEIKGLCPSPSTRLPSCGTLFFAGMRKYPGRMSIVKELSRILYKNQKKRHVCEPSLHQGKANILHFL